MALTTSYGQELPLPQADLASVYFLPTSQIADGFDPTNPHQHVWTTSNGWIGTTTRSNDGSDSPRAMSFWSTLKTIGHDVIKALPTIVEVGLDIAEVAAVASRPQTTSGKPTSYRVNLNPALDGLPHDLGNGVHLLVTSSSVSRFRKKGAEISEDAATPSRMDGLRTSLGTIGSAILRDLTAHVGAVDLDTFREMVTNALQQAMPNVVSSAVGGTPTVKS